MKEVKSIITTDGDMGHCHNAPCTNLKVSKRLYCNNELAADMIDYISISIQQNPIVVPYMAMVMTRTRSTQSEEDMVRVLCAKETKFISGERLLELTRFVTDDTEHEMPASLGFLDFGIGAMQIEQANLFRLGFESQALDMEEAVSIECNNITLLVRLKEMDLAVNKINEIRAVKGCFGL